MNLKSWRKIGGSDRDTDEDSSIVGYNAVLTGKQLLAYQDMLLHLFSEPNQ
jgi:hypothetical protein